MKWDTAKRRQLRFPEQRSHFFGKFSIIRHGPQNQTTLRRVDGARGGPEGSLACNGPLSAMGLPGLQPQQIFTPTSTEITSTNSSRFTISNSKFARSAQTRPPTAGRGGGVGQYVLGLMGLIWREKTGLQQNAAGLSRSTRVRRPRAGEARL